MLLLALQLYGYYKSQYAYTCFSPGCKSGYRSKNKINEEKIHFFKVKQKDLQAWSGIIPRKDKILSDKCSICHLHFEDRFLVKEDKHIINGQTVVMPRLRWTLTEDAIPTKFPNLPKYLSRTEPKKRTSPSKRKRTDVLQIKASSIQQKAGNITGR